MTRYDFWLNTKIATPADPSHALYGTQQRVRAVLGAPDLTRTRQMIALWIGASPETAALYPASDWVPCAAGRDR